MLSELNYLFSPLCEITTVINKKRLTRGPACGVMLAWDGMTSWAAAWVHGGLVVEKLFIPAESPVLVTQLNAVLTYG